MYKLTVTSFFILYFLVVSCDNTSTQDSQINEQSTVLEANQHKDAIPEKYKEFNQFSEEQYDELMTNLASYIIRKPAAATWETKFNPEFREHYNRNKKELNLVCLTQINERTYFYLLREARTADGKALRGVGGSFVLLDNGSFSDFEEKFVSKTLPEVRLNQLGVEYLDLLSTNKSTDSFLNRMEHIEWPDGRLFYSKEKAEWRYVE
jgi:hypothetical protein